MAGPVPWQPFSLFRTKKAGTLPGKLLGGRRGRILRVRAHHARLSVRHTRWGACGLDKAPLTRGARAARRRRAKSNQTCDAARRVGRCTPPFRHREALRRTWWHAVHLYIAQTTTRVATARTRARGSARLFVVRSHLLWRVWLSLPRRAARSRDAAARARAPTPLIPTPFSHTCLGPPCAPRAPAAGWPPRGRRGCLLARRQAAAPRPAPRLRNRAPRRRPPRGGRRPSPATSRVRCRGAWWAGRRAPREQSGGCDAKTPDCQ